MTICPYCGSNEIKFIKTLSPWKFPDELVEERVFKCMDCLSIYTKLYKLEEVDACEVMRKLANKRD